MHPCTVFPGRRALLLSMLLAVMTIGMPNVAAADEGATAEEIEYFSLRAARIRMHEDVYVLDAISHLQLSPRVAEALEGGVNLHIAFEIEIHRQRDWWLDATVAEMIQQYRIEYHELTRQYVVTNINTGQQRGYHSRQAAMNAIGRLLAFPLVDRVLIDDPERHYGRVRVRLQREALPLPLRPAALFYSDWNLRSQWATWSFE